MRRATADLPESDEALDVDAHDCVVFDRMLPGGDALEYVAARRRTAWHVPVLFLTGRSDPADRVQGLAWGDDYLGKPFAIPELVLRVPAPAAPQARAAAGAAHRPRHRVSAALTRAGLSAAWAQMSTWSPIRLS